MNATISVPVLERLTWLRHGFGMKRFGEGDLFAAAAADGMTPVLLEQVHSAAVVVVERVPRRPSRADASVTDRPGLALVIKTADCLPMFLVDPERRAVAAAHAGWRGTVGLIARSAVDALGREFGSQPASLLAALGPCIGGACYEVGEDVIGPASRAGGPWFAFAPIPGRPGKYLMDLRASNRAQLEAAGIPSANVFEAGGCTHCDPGLYSYRRDRRSDVRLFNFIGIKADPEKNSDDESEKYAAENRSNESE